MVRVIITTKSIFPKKILEEIQHRWHIYVRRKLLATKSHSILIDAHFKNSDNALTDKQTGTNWIGLGK